MSPAAVAKELGELWHVGLVVPDLDAAIARMTVGLGVRWSSVLEREVPVEVGGAVEQPMARVRWAFTTGNPSYEVIEASSGYWGHGADRPAVHHLGYWTSDLDRDSAALRSQGYEVEALGRDDAGEVRFVYLLAPEGFRVELCPDWARPAWEEWMATGSYPIQFT